MNEGRQSDNVRKIDSEWSCLRGQQPEAEYFPTGLPHRKDLRPVLDLETALLNGRFVTKELLHRGEYCDLYRALDKERGDTVALKIAAISPASDDYTQKLIRNELVLNTRITDYAHVLRIYDIHICSHNGANLLLLSMEYADGGSLRQWLEANVANLEKRRSEGLSIVKAVCEGLASLHDQGIVHKDVKPENVLFVNGRPKMADLGISLLMYSIVEKNQQQEVNTWPEIGTPEYMSPEQFVAPHLLDIDARSDCYSLAVVLFEICHPDCRHPFSGTLESLRYRHLQVPAPDIPDLDENTRRVIARGLKKNPPERYQVISDMVLDLEGRLEQTATEITNLSAEEMWVEVLENLQAQDFDAALALCRRILDMEPEHEKASVALEELNKRFLKARQFYNAICVGIRNEPLNHLLGLLLEAVSVYPNHPDGHLVRIQLVSLSREYRETMEAALESAQDNRWAYAAERIRQALQLNPGSSVLQGALEYATGQLAVPEVPPDLPF